MDKYYYLVSQLPTLVFDGGQSIAVAGFLQEARKWLSPRDWNLLSQVNLAGAPPSGQAPKALQSYTVFETGIRHDIARWRQARREGGKYQPTFFSAALIEEGTPLDIEKKLLKLRWDFVETLEIGHYFDLEFLGLFLLKLHILHRLSGFEPDKGLARFRQLCEVDR